MKSDDIIPGTILSDNMFVDFHDKYPYRIKQNYEKYGKHNNKYENDGKRWT